MKIKELKKMLKGFDDDFDVTIFIKWTDKEKVYEKDIMLKNNCKADFYSGILEIEGEE